MSNTTAEKLLEINRPYLDLSYADTNELYGVILRYFKCRNAIESAISSFSHLPICESIEGLLDRFDSFEIQWVIDLTNHLREFGDILPKKVFIAESQAAVPSEALLRFCALNTPPEMLILFETYFNLVTGYSADMPFGMWQCSHDTDYLGRILVIRPEKIKGDKLPQNQLFYCESEDNAVDLHKRKVSGVNLSTDEKETYWRSDFYGILCRRYIPEWAKEKQIGIALANDILIKEAETHENPNISDKP